VKHLWVLGLILLIAAALRLTALDHLPPPLNQDEASRGYDAWSLLETGADRYGQRWPFFLESFGPGDYTAALSTYLTIPFVAILGPTTTAMRLPDALLSVATVLLVYLWLTKGMGSAAAMLGAGMLATDPWHTTLTRTAHESGFAPFFLIMGLYSLSRAGILPWPRIVGRSNEHAMDLQADGPGSNLAAAVWAGVGGVGLAFAAWVYPATRLFTPLLCIAMLIVFWSRAANLKRRPAVALSLLAGLIVAGSPLWITAITHPRHLAARASSALLSDTVGDRTSVIGAFLSNYVSNLGPRNLFLSTDDISGLTFAGIGQHAIIFAPVLLLGLWCVLACVKHNRWAVMLLVWLALYPIPAAICRDWNPHPMRTVGGILIFPTIAAIGFERILEWSRRLGRPRWVPVAVGFLALWFANVCFCIVRYSKAISNADFEYQATLIRAIDFVVTHRGDSRFVLVSSRSNQPYIYVLLKQPIRPADLPSHKMVHASGRWGFDQVLQLRDWFFVPSTHKLQDPEKGLEVFKHCLSEISDGAVGLVIQTETESPQGELLMSFPSRNPIEKSRNFQVRRWIKGL
jgi:4-amino-4-deoxy-L-arabinose transferase-like glycosyltransferase